MAAERRLLDRGQRSDHPPSYDPSRRKARRTQTGRHAGPGPRDHHEGQAVFCRLFQIPGTCPEIQCFVQIVRAAILENRNIMISGCGTSSRVLRTAGATKRKELDADEELLVMRTLRDMNLSKFVAQDVPLFLSLLADLFPAITDPARWFSRSGPGNTDECHRQVPTHRPRFLAAESDSIVRDDVGETRHHVGGTARRRQERTSSTCCKMCCREY